MQPATLAALDSYVETTLPARNHERWGTTELYTREDWLAGYRARGEELAAAAPAESSLEGLGELRSTLPDLEAKTRAALPANVAEPFLDGLRRLVTRMDDLVALRTRLVGYLCLPAEATAEQVGDAALDAMAQDESALFQSRKVAELTAQLEQLQAQLAKPMELKVEVTNRPAAQGQCEATGRCSFDGVEFPEAPDARVDAPADDDLPPEVQALVEQELDDWEKDERDEEQLADDVARRVYGHVAERYQEKSKEASQQRRDLDIAERELKELREREAKVAEQQRGLDVALERAEQQGRAAASLAIGLAHVERIANELLTVLDPASDEILVGFRRGGIYAARAGRHIGVIMPSLPSALFALAASASRSSREDERRARERAEGLERLAQEGT